MILEKAILCIHPDAAVHEDFVIVIGDDGEHVIQQWNYDKYPEMPTQEQLDAAWVDAYRKIKFQEFNEICNKEILGYFEAAVDSVAYLFSFDVDAQSNFNGTLSFFTKGLITEVEWTAHRNGKAERIILNETQFLEVVKAAFAHKESKVKHLRNVLEPKIKAATTAEEVEGITW